MGEAITRLVYQPEPRYGYRFDPTRQENVKDFEITPDLTLAEHVEQTAAKIQDLLDRKHEVEGELAFINDAIGLQSDHLASYLSVNPYNQAFDLLREVKKAIR